ncbi:MAG: hypothetical protein ACK58T_22795, partial [Phycisphaerae bacterium]
TATGKPAGRNAQNLSSDDDEEDDLEEDSATESAGRAAADKETAEDSGEGNSGRRRRGRRRGGRGRGRRPERSENRSTSQERADSVEAEESDDDLNDILFEEDQEDFVSVSAGSARAQRSLPPEQERLSESADLTEADEADDEESD